MSNKVKILDKVQIQQKINRLAYEVYENNFSEKSLLIVGIEGNGYKVAASIADKLKEISKIKIQLGKIKIDKDKPWDGTPQIDFNEKDFVNKNVIIVDDVLNSGKKYLPKFGVAAVDEIVDASTGAKIANQVTVGWAKDVTGSEGQNRAVEFAPQFL
ncbi:MAG: phosphoribosyltransferase family protein, partial [Bacteroidia bacterium]